MLRRGMLLFLVENDPYRMECEIADVKIRRDSGSEKCLDRGGFFLIEQQFEKYIGIKKIHVSPATHEPCAGA
jgi:hypothetical protein